MKLRLALVGAACLCTTIDALTQDILIYHGPNNGSEIKVFSSAKQLITGAPLRLNQGQKFTVRVINSNDLFYKYEVKYEEQKDESESKEVTDALAALSSVLGGRLSRASATEAAAFDNWKIARNNLIRDINEAQRLITQSEVAELEIDALNDTRAAGLKYAVEQVTGQSRPAVALVLPNTPGRFHSPTLLEDLNGLTDAISGFDPVLIATIKSYNRSLVDKVKELKRIVKEAKAEWQSEFVVTEKTTKVFLAIKPSDPINAGTLTRKFHTGDNRKEIITIIPYYKRAVLELVPVGNFLFAKDVKEFYIENKVVQSRLRTKTIFTPGAVFNVNVANFGAAKEMSAGLGVGYKFSPNAEVFENFHFATLFSYKNFLELVSALAFLSFRLN